MSRLAFFGGAFNPPHMGHKKVADFLLRNKFFDLVVVKPCGLRDDKPILKKNVDERRSVIKSFFGCAVNLLVDVRGMDQPFIPTWTEYTTHQNNDVWLIFGTDLFIDKGNGRSEMQGWLYGEQLFNEAKFYIVDSHHKGEIIWPKHYIYAEEFEPHVISSTDIRNQLEKENV